MISGVSPMPEFVIRRVAKAIAESGSRSIATTPAPIPTAAAGVTSKPGRWEASTPAATPRNIAGNVGPPRKAPGESPTRP